MSFSNLSPIKKTILIASTALSPPSPHLFALLRFRVTLRPLAYRFQSRDASLADDRAGE